VIRFVTKIIQNIGNKLFGEKMSNDEKEVKIKLLSDEAVEQDSIGSHEKVADSITRVINESEGGKAIALRGKWGSGKSSIIKMLKMKLDDSFKVFVYNAWAHEGDPLRRSFLESIINYLLDIGLLKKKKDWDEFKKELAGRKEIVVIENTTNPEPLGIIIAFVTALVPFGLVSLSLWPNSMVDDWVAISFSLSIAGIILLYGMISLFISKERRKKYFSIISQSHDKTTTTESYKTLDPTSIEFQDKFFEVINESLNNSNNQKLVIVIDNLDRVDVEDSIKLWSNMKTFFDFEKSEIEEFMKKVWLIVPFDSEGIRRMWKAKNRNDTDDKEHIEIVNSFLDKTFQISFEVPPPILSDWENFFKDKFKLVFENYNSDEEMHRAYRIFRVKCASELHPPTPRDIKLFLNELGSSFLQHKEDIPLHIQALYIVLRKKEWNTDSKLLAQLTTTGSDFLSPLSEPLVDPEYREYLAALFFRVPKESAVQLLIANKVEIALNTTDANSLKKLVDFKGFEQVCEEVIEKNSFNWISEDPNIIGKSILLYQELQLGESDSSKGIWNSLYRACNSIKKWEYFSLDSAKGLVLLIKKTISGEIVDSIFKSIESSNLFDIEKVKEKKRHENFEAICELIKEISSIKGGKLIKDALGLNISATAYISSLYLILDKDDYKDVFQLIVPNCDSESLITELVGRIKSRGLLGSKWLQVCKILDSLGVVELWDEFIDALIMDLAETTEKEEEEIVTKIEILLYLNSDEDKIKDKLDELTRKGGFFHNFNIQAADNTTSRSFSLMYYLLLMYNTEPAIVNGPVGNSQSGINKFKNILAAPDSHKDLVTNVAMEIISQNKVNVLFEIAENNKETKNFIQSLIAILADKEEFIDSLSKEDLIENESLIYNSLTEDDTYYDDYMKFIKSFNQKKDLISIVCEREFNVEKSSLYSALLSAVKAQNSNLVEHLINNLRGVTEDMWVEESKAGYICILDLVVQMSNYGISLDLGVPFKSFLNSYFEQVNTGGEIIEKLTSHWNTLAKALDEDNKVTLLRDIRDKILYSDTNISNIIENLGYNLIDRNILEEKADDVIRRLFEKYSSSQDILFLKLLNHSLSHCSNLSSGFSKSSRKSIKASAEIELSKEESSNDLREELTSLINNL
jgi:hypothetical protein